MGLPLDQTPALLREGYLYLSHRRPPGADVYQMRLLGERATCLVGAEAAALIYDQRRFQRAGALPGPVRNTLTGDGAVQGLDGNAHWHRKAMFMSLLTPERVEALAQRVAGEWRKAAAGWPGRDRVVLFVAAALVFTRATCDWCGVPLAPDELGTRARDLVTMVDGFGTVGPRHWRARLARRRSERWLAGLVELVRAGRINVPADSPLAVIAEHHQPDGTPLDSRTAAVELLNLLRPTAAIAWFVAFAAHALHNDPQWRDRLRGGDAEELHWFAQEVRRFYPFAPAVGARVREEFEWRGHRLPRGRLVLLDIYGTNHDPRRWPDPDRFDPVRFAGRQVDPYELVPHGGGDPLAGHRCAGDDLTLRLLEESIRVLVGLDYRLPPQDLEIPLGRIPTRPRSGVVLADVKPTGLRQPPQSTVRPSRRRAAAGPA